MDNNKELFPLASEQPESRDFKRVLQQYSRFWYLFVLGAILGSGAAYLYLRFYAIPQYVVSSTLMIKDDKSTQGLSSADALSDLTTFKSTRSIDNEMEVLKSVSIMERVAKELDLYTSYYVKGRAIDKEIYGQSVPIKVLRNNMDSTAAGKSFTVFLKADNSFQLQDYTGAVTTHRFGQEIKMPYGSFTIVASATKSAVSDKIIVQFNDIHQVAVHYSQAISVQSVGKSSNVLNLTLIDPIPEKAKNIINKLMHVYNNEAIEDKNLMAVSTLKFLDERLRLITAELSGVEKGVEKFKSVNALTDITSQASDFQAQNSTTTQQLSEWATQIDLLESLESYLRKNAGQYSIVPSTLGLKDETLLVLIAKFNELQATRESILRTSQANSFLINNTNEQIANLRANILENLQNIKQGLQITSNNLKRSSGQFQSKIRKVPEQERELQEIKRQLVIKQNIYVYLLQKREETALSLAATASIARILDLAKGGDYPISPNKQVIYIMSTLLGLGIPFAFIFLLGMLNNKVQSQQDVTNAVSVPILGEIAHNSRKETVVVAKGNRSPIAEMFQLVRTNLHFLAPNKNSVVVLATSSMSGEGKTFFSINLAASLATTGKRVVLVDLDLREPRVAMELELPDGPGVTEYLISNDVTLDSIIQPSEKIPGLFVVSSGVVVHNPVELMMGSKFEHFVHELKEKFDYIIMDTAPVGLVSDAFTLSHFVDISIFVVRYNYTQKGQLDIIKNIYKNKTMNIPVIVLNDAKESNGGSYGYGYGYGYDKQDTRKKKVAR
ncbi:MAG: polysaccharide biosynthesis tyrosine autokinase [Hymenobacter sp.]|nr:MAG: polysaccharide biosynthesis tyrosine autokinase [Hymenobacter sp.]